MIAPDRDLKTPVFCALDTKDLSRATGLAAKLADTIGGFKLGLEFFSSQGPKGVKQIQKASDVPIFLDLKLNDIPNTVASAVRAVAPLGIYMLTVHINGGRAMMEAAAAAAADAAYEAVKARPLIVGVTVLTSFDDDDLAEVGVSNTLVDQVRRMAELAKRSGLDGVVCSPREVAMLRSDLGDGFKLVTPGVRPEWASVDDQKRFMTPLEAVSAGSDYLVIGRPITAAKDPPSAAARIVAEITPVELSTDDV
ncbi:MAG TPA: orotidine-5'-phosphate decarboxylase [Rhodospirillaceae bacterium]|nr:orotidine-5'-phosphate decarboxylase [Candidatus Neomarinimicrobiota bacterium]HCX14791.1 orotidine-5'-phosphate decarboxylase [Rhodospirillaceae bacterium]